VQKELSAKERKKLQEITRGLPELRKLRERLKKFKRLSQLLKKIESPVLEHSLVFLDDKQLPLTANAVEWGNRRFRKMQKTVYWVRTEGNIRAF